MKEVTIAVKPAVDRAGESTVSEGDLISNCTLCNREVAVTPALQSLHGAHIYICFECVLDMMHNEEFGNNFKLIDFESGEEMDI